MPFKPNSPSDMGLEFDAIIGTKPGSAGGWHWLVWDSMAKKLLNPLSESESYRGARYYIRVGEET